MNRSTTCHACWASSLCRRCQSSQTSSTSSTTSPIAPNGCCYKWGCSRTSADPGCARKSECNSDHRKCGQAIFCYLSHKPFGESPTMNNVRDHYPITGRFRVAAHWQCNIELRKTYKIRVFLHNFSVYDSHLVVQALNMFPQGNISVMRKAMEKYLALSWGRPPSVQGFPPDSLVLAGTTGGEHGAERQ